MLLHREAGPYVTLLDIVSKPFEHLLSALISLVFAPIVMLQSHLGIVKRSSTQDTMLIRVLQISLCAEGGCDYCRVWKLHTPVLGWFLDVRISSYTW